MRLYLWCANFRFLVEECHPKRIIYCLYYNDAFSFYYFKTRMNKIFERFFSFCVLIFTCIPTFRKQITTIDARVGDIVWCIVVVVWWHIPVAFSSSCRRYRVSNESIYLWGTCVPLDTTRTYGCFVSRFLLYSIIRYMHLSCYLYLYEYFVISRLYIY